MRVPKMVKNGFNSVLQTSAGSRRLVAARNSGTMRSPKLSPNHKRPIKTISDQFRNKHARLMTARYLWPRAVNCAHHLLYVF